MSKEGLLTPKAITNRMKSKGPRKLRWYCQMCQKQCRDENGFKCHTSSESHQRQLLLFADNPGKYINQFSQEFLDNFMQLLKRRFRTKRVPANEVYQEYISDSNHVHMNSTKWETLTDFVRWLGQNGLCVVDEVENRWFVSYVDRDPETIRHHQLVKKQEKRKFRDEKTMANLWMERDNKKHKPESIHTDLMHTDKKVSFVIKSVKSKVLVR